MVVHLNIHPFSPLRVLNICKMNNMNTMEQWRLTSTYTLHVGKRSFEFLLDGTAPYVLMSLFHIDKRHMLVYDS